MIEIVTGDCREVLKAFRPSSFDMCLTDPPYRIPFVYRDTRPEQYRDGRESWYNEALPEFREWLKEVVRVLKPSATIMVFEASRNWRELYDAMEKAYIKVKHTLIWHVTNRYQPFTNSWTCDYDVLLYGLTWPAKARTWNEGGGKEQFSDVFTSKWCVAHEDVAGVKPIRFLRNVIKTVTKPQDIILDPFMGSGTTLQAARLEGRRSVGIEMRRDIAVAVKKRLGEQKAMIDDFGT